MTKKIEKQDAFAEAPLEIELPRGWADTPESLSEAGKRAWADGDRSSEAMAGTPIVADEHPKPLDMRLQHMVAELIAMQHARATAGGGHSTHWQNAQRHIREAIADIEQQTATDSRR